MNGQALNKSENGVPAVDVGVRTVVVAARGASKVYGHGAGEVRALDSIDLDIEQGRLTAIMGPSGSGKSTLMHLLAGLDNPTSGTVVLGEVELSGLSDRERTLIRRRSVGFVFQSFNLVPTLDVISNVTLPFELDGVKPSPERVQWIHELLNSLRIGQLRKRRPTELSGGQQQRVAIARALAMQPAVIFADEPTGNLDSRSGREVLEMLAAASRDGQTVVLVTHDPVAASYADRIVFIADGRIVLDVGRSTPQDLSEIALGLETRA